MELVQSRKQGLTQGALCTLISLQGMEQVQGTIQVGELVEGCIAVAAAAPGVDTGVLRPLVFLPGLVPPPVLAMSLFFLVPPLLGLVLGKVLGLGLQVAALDMGPAQGTAQALGFALKLFCLGQVGG